MKIRTGFVSNSSSASFVASLHVLTEAEKQAIMNYCTDPEQNEDGWTVHEEKEAGLLTGSTNMDNGAFSDWCEKQGLNKIRFGL
jgi:hypothetical protein